MQHPLPRRPVHQQPLCDFHRELRPGRGNGAALPGGNGIARRAVRAGQYQLIPFPRRHLRRLREGDCADGIVLYVRPGKLRLGQDGLVPVHNAY